jgi:hypothetical protein
VVKGSGDVVPVADFSRAVAGCTSAGEYYPGCVHQKVSGSSVVLSDPDADFQRAMSAESLIVLLIVAGAGRFK